MQKRVNSLFGGEAMYFAKESDKGGEHTTLWNSFERDSAGNSKLQIEVISSKGRLKEVKVREMVDGSVFTTRFDSSYNLHGWEPQFKDEHYDKLAEQHKRNIPAFLRSILSIHDISESPKDVFYPLFIKEVEHEPRKLEKPAPRAFKETVKVQESKLHYVSINFPMEVVDAMGLKGGMQAAVTAEGKSAVLTQLEGVHYEATVRKWGNSLGVTIPTELMTSMKLRQDMQCEWTAEGNSLLLTPLETFHRTVKPVFVNRVSVTVPEELAKSKKLTKGMVMQWSVEGDNKLSFKPADSASPNAVKLQYHDISNSYSVTIPAKIVKSTRLVRGMYGTWTGETDKLVLEINKRKSELGVEDTLFINQTKIQAANNSHVVVIPDAMSKKLHLKLGMLGEWFTDGEKLSLELGDDYPHIQRFRQTNTATARTRYRGYGEEVSLYIPKAVSEAVGLNKNTEVGFRIDDEGRLVITPKPGLPKKLD